MKRTRSALLCSCLLSAIAACDGGSRGSGITTAQGNVESVQTALRGSAGGPARTALARLRSLLAVAAPAYAQNALEGIRVSIEGTPLAAQTDADGVFTLRGNFEGVMVIRFQRDGDAASAAVTVNAPAGGTLTLNDVRLDERSGLASARSQGVLFEGLVADASCADAAVRLVSPHRSRTDTDVYTVRLDTSTLHDPQGAPVACESLVEGDRLRLDGTVNDDGSFGHADILRER
jgi:hypothetical protein